MYIQSQDIEIVNNDVPYSASRRSLLESDDETVGFQDNFDIFKHLTSLTKKMSKLIRKFQH